eukprot:TRINITY_DN71159_c0_g1_i1.p1 TRINITY_DN71159_c0_g1~~TRINITY_DN71159_c0_g1_i1.p1  ORF type:complete len:271 (+),score=49.71 TRINITY_DN71159_c0_g1_i1:71-883(+)
MAARAFTLAQLAHSETGQGQRALHQPLVRVRAARWGSSKVLASCSQWRSDREEACYVRLAAFAFTAAATVTTTLLSRSRRRQASSKLRADRRISLQAFEDEPGVQPPLGFWDPMGFTDEGGQAAFRRRRSVEFKHGRISMLATMGYITPELVGKWPGYLSPSMGVKYSDIPNGLGALLKVPSLGWVQILTFFGFVEYSGGFEDYRTGTPGDYGWKVLTSSDSTERRRKLDADLANGRLAMVAIMAMLFQDGLTGSAWGDWAAQGTVSALR